MSTKIKFDKFDPTSVKVVGKKKVTAKFFDIDIPTRGQTNDETNLPEQSLLDTMTAFGEDMARALGLLDGWDHAIDALAGKNDLDNSKLARDGYDAAILSCTVNGISFHGEQRQSIQLTGSVVTKAGTQTQKTPHISLDPEKNEFAKDMLVKVDELKKELWGYLFGGKFIKTERKKKEEAEKEALNQFDHAIENGGEFAQNN